MLSHACCAAQPVAPRCTFIGTPRRSNVAATPIPCSRGASRALSVRVAARQNKNVAPAGVAASPSRAYTPPSHTGAETELTRLSKWSQLVPDTALPERVRALHGAATAASVSHGALLRAAETPSRDFEAALQGALAYDRCRLAGGGANTACILDKALVNVAAELAGAVSGRVSVEVDARLANDTDKMVAKAHALLEMFQEMGIHQERLLFRLPATWAALAAVRKLESEGLQCHVTHVFTLAQAAAAAHARAAVVQPSVGRLAAYYAAHPNAQRPGARGTRADAGSLSLGKHEESAADAAGRDLTAACVAYVAKRGGGTRVMAQARSGEEAAALAGVDFLVVGVDVLEKLAATPTAAGYNDGLFGAASAAADEARSPVQMRAAAAADLLAASFGSADGDFSDKKEDFEAALNAGPGAELLKAALAHAQRAATNAEAHFAKMWPPQGGL